MATWDHEEMQYVIAVNPTGDIQAISFDIGASGNQQVEVLFEERALMATDDGRVGDAFQPFEVHIYVRKL